MKLFIFILFVLNIQVAENLCAMQKNEENKDISYWNEAQIHDWLNSVISQNVNAAVELQIDENQLWFEVYKHSQKMPIDGLILLRASNEFKRPWGFIESLEVKDTHSMEVEDSVGPDLGNEDMLPHLSWFSKGYSGGEYFMDDEHMDSYVASVFMGDFKNLAYLKISINLNQVWFERFCASLAMNTSLVELYLPFLTKEKVSALSLALRKNKTLFHLSCSVNGNDDACVENIGTIFGKNNTLKSFTFCDFRKSNNFVSKFISYILDYNLTHIKLGDVSFEAAASLMDILEGNRKIVRLEYELPDWDQQHEGNLRRKLAKILERNLTIEESFCEDGEFLERMDINSVLRYTWETNAYCFMVLREREGNLAVILYELIGLIYDKIFNLSIAECRPQYRKENFNFYQYLQQCNDACSAAAYSMLDDD